MFPPPQKYHAVTLIARHEMYQYVWHCMYMILFRSSYHTIRLNAPPQTHASELNLGGERQTLGSPAQPPDATTDVPAEFPIVLDETKLGAELLHIPVDKTHGGSTPSAVLFRLKEHVSTLIKRLLRSSDTACKWSWRCLACKPKEACKLKPQWGDLHLGQACRARESEEEWSARSSRFEDWMRVGSGRIKRVSSRACQGVDRVRDRVVHHAARGLASILRRVRSRLPSTDAECKFDVVTSVGERTTVCVPRETCAFQYRFGDVMLDRCCRLKAPGEALTDPVP